MSDRTTPADVTRVKLWDPALRLFHWALVVAVVSAWMLGQFGPNIMALHFYFGYAVIGLLIFRILWGFIGPAPARFGHFIFGPKTLFAYLRGIGKREPSYWPGHNPVGALAVFALLAFLAFQVATGLFADPDDFINVGPFAHMLDSEGTRTATKWHNRMAWGLFGLVILHIGANLFYAIWKHEDLIGPMVTGWKKVRRDRDA